ncbi:MAG: bifunctional riboflavin kinase/FAD synthetase [Pseudomonadota bacterium]
MAPTHPPFVEHDLAAPLPEVLRGAVLAIGNFDGVHRGHQHVLARAMKEAERLKTRCFALSFEPHPRTLFKPHSPVFRLTPPPMKGQVLEAFGCHGLLTLAFTKELAGTQAEEFVTRYLVDNAGAAHVISGFNFHFGKAREGSPAFLKEAGARHGFGVTIVDAHHHAGEEEPVSSSRIRRCLGAGDTGGAADLLGYRWAVCGEVVKGQQIGRTLGYPTANLVLPPSCKLAHGIYAVRFRRADGTLYDGVASYGRRPTFDNGAAWLETFVFDFEGDLYGETVTVSLFDYLRGEEKFESAEALVEQMDRDSEAARSVLTAAKPLSSLDEAMSFADGSHG